MILLATVVFPEALPPHNPADPHTHTATHFKGPLCVFFRVCLMLSGVMHVWLQCSVYMGIIRQSGTRGEVLQEDKNINVSEWHTDDKGLFRLSSVLVVPGRSAGGVDGSCARAEQRRLGFTQRGSALPAGGPGGGQQPVQRVLPTPTATHSKTGTG